MRRTTERSRASRVVAVASALLQSVASVQVAVGFAWLSMLFSLHAHEHALSSVRDGNHLDLVLSHDAARDGHDHGDDTHLHVNSASDHVVHLTSDEALDSRRSLASGFAVTLAVSRPFSAAPARLGSARPTPPTRPVPPLSRRSVVLRT